MTFLITKEQLPILIGGAFAGVGFLTGLKAQEDIVPVITYDVHCQIHKMFKKFQPNKLNSGIRVTLLIGNEVAGLVGRVVVLTGICCVSYFFGSTLTKVCFAAFDRLKV